MQATPNGGRRRLSVLGEDSVAEAHHRTKGLIRVTMACNERCPFCNVPVEDYAEATPPEARLHEELDAFLASGERTLTLSGGEPTLYRDRVLTLTRRARQAGVPFVELQTNAVLIDDGYATALADAGLTSAFVSLLSHVPELHDELAGLKGAFPRCLEGIDALLDAGVSVTLNPVIAASTDDKVLDFVTFVSERLPRVRSISLSAVQPHGRAARVTELLPDYARLREQVPRARALATARGIALLNPYCGLPLCVGWEDDEARSVEALEAREQWRSRSAHRPHGVDNRGNKAHGSPCQACALRTRCGGAWHAYWRERGGSGLRAPKARVEPWHAGALAAPAQAVISAPEGLGDSHFTAIAACDAPTVWALTARLAAGDAQRLHASGCTDLAVLSDVPALDQDAETLEQLITLRKHNAGLEPQARLRVVVGLRRLGSFQRAHALLTRLSGEVEAVRLLLRGDARIAQFAREMTDRCGMSVTAA